MQVLSVKGAQESASGTSSAVQLCTQPHGGDDRPHGHRILTALDVLSDFTWCARSKLGLRAGPAPPHRNRAYGHGTSPQRGCCSPVRCLDRRPQAQGAPNTTARPRWSGRTGRLGWVLKEQVPWRVMGRRATALWRTLTPLLRWPSSQIPCCRTLHRALRRTAGPPGFPHPGAGGRLPNGTAWAGFVAFFSSLSGGACPPSRARSKIRPLECATHHHQIPCCRGLGPPARVANCFKLARKSPKERAASEFSGNGLASGGALGSPCNCTMQRHLLCAQLT